MTALIFIGAIVWGSLAAQFLVQTITSLIIATLYLAALPFSEVSRSMNAMGTVVSLVQVIFFAALFAGGNWIAVGYIDFGGWNPTSIAFLISFLATTILIARQAPGKILLARLSAWAPHFAQALMNRPRHERIELARKFQASPTMNTLYASPTPSETARMRARPGGGYGST